MQINNPFFLKDWKIEDFLLFITSVLMLFFLFSLLHYLGLNITPFKEIIGLILVLFIPGTIFLRLLNLKIENAGMIFLYTIGSSLFILILMGFLINTLYPLFGFETPLSPISIIITLNFFIIAFSFLCYIKDKQLNLEDLNKPEDIKHYIKKIQSKISNLNKPKEIKNTYSKKLNIQNLFTIPILVSILIPIISILGAYIMNLYQSNILIIIMILMIGLLTFFISINKFIPSNIYPFIIFAISLALVLHKSLITNYIWGWDINGEYFLANQIISNSFWNSNLPYNYNSMLSVMILAPILSNFINLNLVWVMKIVYPFIFSLVPLGLYYVYYKQTTAKIAFFSAFFFMILFTFHTEMLTVARQQVAELFLVLVLMLLVTDNIDKNKRILLAVIFGLSIIVSHYGIAYLMMIILIISTVILYIIDKNYINRFFIRLKNPHKINMIFNHLLNLNLAVIKKHNIPIHYKESGIVEKIKKYKIIKKDRLIINLLFLPLFIIFIFIWYHYTSNSSILQSFINIGLSIVDNLFKLMNPSDIQGLNMVVQTQVTFLKNIHKYLYLLSEFLIFIGVVSLFFGRDGMKFKDEYKALSISTLIILVTGIILPLFSSQMNTTRLYHIALIILAPFCVLGIIRIVEKFKNTFNINLNRNNLFKAISIFFIIFLIFDTGLTNQILDPQQTTSIALNPSFDFPKFNQKEVTAGNWLSLTKYDYPVYADKNRASVLRSMIFPVLEIPYYFDLVQNQTYIFLGNWNTEKNQVLIYNMEGSNIITDEKYVSPLNILQGRSRIYDNGGAEIYSPTNY